MRKTTKAIGLFSILAVICNILTVVGLGLLISKNEMVPTRQSTDDDCTAKRNVTYTWILVIGILCICSHAFAFFAGATKTGSYVGDRYQITRR